MTDEDAALIAGYEVVVKNARAGDWHTIVVHKVRLRNHAKFVELAARRAAHAAANPPRIFLKKDWEVLRVECHCLGTGRK